MRERLGCVIAISWCVLLPAQSAAAQGGSQDQVVRVNAILLRN